MTVDRMIKCQFTGGFEALVVAWTSIGLRMNINISLSANMGAYDVKNVARFLSDMVGRRNMRVSDVKRLFLNPLLCQMIERIIINVYHVICM